MDEINFFAETTARGMHKKFGIKLDDRRRHMYVIGKTGMGKSQMLQNMAIQDIQAGRGVGIIDPHGEFAEAVLDYVPSQRINDVIYFNPADIEMPIGFNIMERVGAEQRYFIASGLMAAFEKIWVDVWSARMKYILNNTILALLEYPNSTILGVNRMLADKEYRKKIVDNVKDSAIKSYWINEFAKYPERYREEAVSAIQNKIGQFISNPLIRNIVGQTKSTFNMREVMDNQKILIFNLAKGRVGEENTALLGTMLITKIQIAAMSRVDTPEEERKDFFLYVDEFQTFATPSFANILSEARKYRLALILAHQYIAQMDEVVRDAAFGNAGTLVSFRVGAADAEFMEPEFTPSFLQEDLVNLGKYTISLKLMIDGIASKAFSARTLPPLLKPEQSYREKIIRVSRERYGNSSAKIEEKISKWSGLMKKEEGPTYSRPALYSSAPSSSISPRGFFASPKFSAPATLRSQQPHTELGRPEFIANCSNCGRQVKLSFKPDPGRPVYCRECFIAKKTQQAQLGNRNLTGHTMPAGRQAGRDAARKNIAPTEISLNEAVRRSPPDNQMPQGPNNPSDFTGKVRPAVARKAVNITSLRSTLEDIVSPNKNNDGIISEGESINF